MKPAVTNQRQMVRITDARDAEIADFDLRTGQDKVQLLSWAEARIGGFARGVGGHEAGSRREKLDFIIPPEGVEIARDYDRFGAGLDEIIKVGQLVMPMPVFERKMDQENPDSLKLELDQEPLDTRLEIMEMNLPKASPGDERVGLFPDDR